MKIFVISLKNSVERRQHIQSQFEGIGVPFEFLDAVDGRKEQHPLFAKYNLSKRMKTKGYEMTRGELGCFASHYLLWEKCIQINEPIIVIEDDAQLEECFLESFKDIRQLVQHEYVRLFVDGRGRKIKKLGTYKEHEIVQYYRGPGATRAYLITPKASRKFIDSAQEWYLPVDDYMDLFWINKVPCKGIKPGMVKNETDFDSSIGELNRRDKKNKLSREIYSFKMSILRQLYLLRH